MAYESGHKLTLKTLEIGHYGYDFALLSDWFGSIEKSEITAGSVQVRAELDLREADYDLHMWLEGSVQVPCDRCLEPVEYEVKIDEEIECEPVEQIDLEWLAYELIETNLPLVHCHPEGGCNPAMAQLLQDHLCRAEEEPEE